MVRFDDLTSEQRRLINVLFEHLEEKDPNEWLLLIDGLRDLAVDEALAKVPYKGPYPMRLSPFD